MLLIMLSVMLLQENMGGAYDLVITHIILVYEGMTDVLFDQGSTYFYVSVRLASKFEMLCDVLDFPIPISTPVGESFIIIHVYRVCPILFIAYQTG